MVASKAKYKGPQQNLTFWIFTYMLSYYQKKRPCNTDLQELSQLNEILKSD